MVAWNKQHYDGPSIERHVAIGQISDPAKQLFVRAVPTDRHSGMVNIEIKSARITNPHNCVAWNVAEKEVVELIDALMDALVQARGFEQENRYK